MPGIPSAVTDIFAQLEALNSIKPKTEEEAYGLAQAKQELMNQAQQTSEGMGQMDPHELRGDGFTGRIDGKVFDAPWRGEFDMPGNFEREQRMANSLAEDAYANAGRGSRTEMGPNGLMEGKIIRTTPAHSAIMGEAGLGDFTGTRGAIFDGPPEVSKYGMLGSVESLNRGSMLSEDQLKSIERMLSGGNSRMKASYDRRYKNNSVYQKMFGGQ